MAIENIRKLNVRSPYFVEVVDEYLGGAIPPDPAPDPITTSDSLECSGIMYFGAWVGIRRFVLDTTDKQFGDYIFSIANAKVPVKFTAYIEGDTPPAYDTIGLDTYAIQWLAETGDDASLLSSETANPDGVTRNFTFTTSAADVSKNIIVEVFAPMATENDMSITSTSCQPLINAQLPSTTDFVTVVTVAVHSVYNIFVNGATVPPSDINIKLNGTNYPLPNVSANSGVRLICHDATPDYSVLTNNFPYSRVNGGFPIHQRKWSYSTSGDAFAPTLVPQELVSGAVTSGINELVITTAAGIGCNVDVRIANHVVSNHPTTPNQRVINHRGDNSYTKISTTGKGLNMGNSTLASEEVFTVKFSNVNQKDVIINEATYRHEVVQNEGDSVDQIDDLISPINQLPIYYL
jgi:hypothetical protein